MKFVKGKKLETGARAKTAVKSRPIDLAGPANPPSKKDNPWIDRRLFDLMQARCIAAENMCKDLIRVIAVDDGEFLASHDADYLAAGNAILKGDV